MDRHLAMAVDPALERVPRELTNRGTFSYPTAKVYTLLTETVESKARKFVEPFPATYTRRVSYLSSFLTNNWGGVIRVALTVRHARPS
jgi:hypothetical protein